MQDNPPTGYPAFLYLVALNKAEFPCPPGNAGSPDCAECVRMMVTD